jgi:hypothetical protein
MPPEPRPLSVIRSTRENAGWLDMPGAGEVGTCTRPHELHRMVKTA